jgi:GT2 family glycosyltransferase
MKVGAFVMTFNRPEGLERSLAYLLGQSRRPDEIWVIDNGSGTAARTRSPGSMLTPPHDTG